jgi:hypothetical protein
MSEDPYKNRANQAGGTSSRQSYYDGTSVPNPPPAPEEPVPPPRPPAPPGGDVGRSPRPPVYDEKYDEKGGEKRGEKDEKSGRNEKNEKEWDEKVRRDPLNAITWAAVLMWAGVAFLLSNLGVLRSLIGPLIGPRFMMHADLGWGVFMIGAGLLLLAEAAIRLVSPQYARSVTGTVLLALIFLGIGLGNLFSWAIAGPLMLIAIGAWLLWRGFLRPRR